MGAVTPVRNHFNQRLPTEAVQRAIESDDVSSLGRINLFTPLPNGEYPLHYAIRCKAYKTVQEMLTYIKNTDWADRHGLSPLDHAMIIKDEKMCALLLGHHVGKTLEQDKMKANPTFVSDLKSACKKEVARRMKAGTYTEENLKSVHSMAFRGDLKALKQVPDSQLHLKDEDGLTPLHHAVMNGRVDVIKWLLAKGCNPNQLTPDGRSILTFAAMAARPYILEFCLKKVDRSLVNRPDNQGYVPLHYCAVAGSLALSKILIEHGADPLLSEGNGKAPLTVMLEIAKEQSNSRDPLALSTLEQITFASIVIPWAVHVTGLSSLGFLNTIMSLFWGLAFFLKHPVESISYVLIGSLFTSVKVCLTTYYSFLAFMGATGGLMKSYFSRNLETYRPIRNAVVHAVNAKGAFDRFRGSPAPKSCSPLDRENICNDKPLEACITSEAINPQCLTHAEFILSQSDKFEKGLRNKRAYQDLRAKINPEHPNAPSALSNLKAAYERMKRMNSREWEELNCPDKEFTSSFLCNDFYERSDWLKPSSIIQDLAEEARSSRVKCY